MDKKRNVTAKNAALIVMSSIIVSRIIGFVRTMLIPNKIGANEVGDAYIIAFKLPDLMSDLLIGGAIAAALVPVLSGYIVKNKEEEGWKAVSTFMNIIFIAMIVFCVLGMIFAPNIIPFVAAGFKSDYQIKLTIKLTRILFPSVCFIMLAGFASGILNSYNKFFAASYGPCIYNIGCVMSIYFLSGTKGGVYSVAWGVTASAFVYFMFQLSFAIKNMKFYRPKIYLNHEGFRKLFKLAVPSMIASSIVHINGMISSSFSSLFGKGSVMAFEMADRVWQMPYGVFAQGIATAILPSLSAKIAVGKVDEFKRTWIRSLKVVLMITIPAAIGLIILRHDIMRAIFQFKNKQVDDNFINLSSSVLMYFALAVITQSLVIIINRAFYAYNDTKTPLYVGSSTILLNMGLSYIFCNYTNLNIAGMALSYLIASLVNATILFRLFNKRIGKLIDNDVLGFCKKIIIGSFVMAFCLQLAKYFTPVVGTTKLLQFIDLLKNVSFGIIAYFIFIWCMKVDEVREIMDIILRKVKLKRA